MKRKSKLTKNSTKSTSPGKEFRCSECWKKFRWIRNLDQHIKMFHGKEDDKVEIFSCSECAFTSKFKRNVKQHYRTVHEGFKPYQCEHCNYRASRKDPLRAHYYRSHPELTAPNLEGEDEIGGTTIVGTTVDESDVQNSIIVDPLSEEVDHMQAISAPVMTISTHQQPDGSTVLTLPIENNPEEKKTKGRKKSFSCCLCKFETAIRLNLNQHMILHHPHYKQFACSICGPAIYSTNSKKELKRHAKKMHQLIQDEKDYLVRQWKRAPLLQAQHLQLQQSQGPTQSTSTATIQQQPQFFIQSQSDHHQQQQPKVIVEEINRDPLYNGAQILPTAIQVSIPVGASQPEDIQNIISNVMKNSALVPASSAGSTFIHHQPIQQQQHQQQTQQAPQQILPGTTVVFAPGPLHNNVILQPQNQSQQAPHTIFTPTIIGIPNQLQPQQQQQQQQSYPIIQTVAAPQLEPVVVTPAHSFQAHQQINKSIPWKCHICDQCFYSSSDLKTHLHEAHKMNKAGLVMKSNYTSSGRTESPYDPNSKYKCESCRKGFSNAYGMRRHFANRNLHDESGNSVVQAKAFEQLQRQLRMKKELEERIKEERDKATVVIVTQASDEVVVNSESVVNNNNENSSKEELIENTKMNDENNELSNSVINDVEVKEEVREENNQQHSLEKQEEEMIGDEVTKMEVEGPPVLRLTRQSIKNKKDSPPPSPSKDSSRKTRSAKKPDLKYACEICSDKTFENIHVWKRHIENQHNNGEKISITNYLKEFS